MVAFGFDSVGILWLETWILNSNSPSRGLFKALGFRDEGLLRQRYFINGRSHDMRVLGLLNTVS
ncbi:GNAT family N-acetyltransferase [Corynebacterium glyciniphilum]|uniref:GNAT family N-acetyltransferase n=1 Tax=Corynebacterium glyciniphilum TaxID=1404244 RepID=UPI003DA10612